MAWLWLTCILYVSTTHCNNLYLLGLDKRNCFKTWFRVRMWQLSFLGNDPEVAAKEKIAFVWREKLTGFCWMHAEGRTQCWIEMKKIDHSSVQYLRNFSITRLNTSQLEQVKKTFTTKNIAFINCFGRIKNEAPHKIFTDNIFKFNIIVICKSKTSAEVDSGNSSTLCSSLIPPKWKGLTIKKQSYVLFEWNSKE